MVRWTTVPPWLYQNDLPDDQLQAVYVEAARRKVVELRAALAEAEAFLADAERTLAHYRADLPARGSPGRATVRELPKPTR